MQPPAPPAVNPNIIIPRGDEMGALRPGLISEICGICKTQFSRYTCPRCNLKYCSLQCYKSDEHAKCSNSFHRDSFMQALSGEKSDDAEKRRMIDLLTRVEEQRRLDEEDELDNEDEGDLGGYPKEGTPRNGPNEVEDVESLAEKFAGFDLENAQPSILWDRLTETERDEFIRTITKTPHLIKPALHEFFLDQWKPWWEPTNVENPRLVQNPKPTIEVIGGRSDSSLEDDEELLSGDGRQRPTPSRPAISSSIVPLANLTSTTPSPSAVFNIPDILLSYAHSMRTLNGDLYEDVWESVGVVLQASTVLAESTRVARPKTDGAETSSTAPTSTPTVSNSLQESLAISRHNFQPPPAMDYWILILRDVVNMLSSYNATLSALSDLHSLLGAASALVEDTGGRSPSPGGSPVPGAVSGAGTPSSARARGLRPFKRRAFLAEKKVLWYACFVQGLREEWEGALEEGRNAEGQWPNPLDVLRNGIEVEQRRLQRELEEFEQKKKEVEAMRADKMKAIREGESGGKKLIQEL